ncbi:MAG: iron ABC transporter substrate-binding protein [Desulfovibrionales bacterium]|nr:MAG: iron ABC transporter substrate-binding protein [Desulfovibrionales bacterium]
MSTPKSRLKTLATLTVLFTIFAAPLNAQDTQSITDMLGRDVVVPSLVDRVICSGSGCLRLLVYLQGQDRIVGVDSAEKGGLPFGVDARPYAVANPGFGEYPLFGEFRGHDNPELIAALDPAPQVILKTNAQRDGGADALQAKTGIPVIGLGYGNLTHGRENLNQTLRIMGQVIGKEERAEAVIAFFHALQADLEQRAARVAEDDRPSTFIGGIAMRGGHGFASTEPAYAPFAFLNVRNVAGDLSTGETGGSHATVAKEQLLLWDPDVVFLDISTTRLQGGANGLEQLRTDPAYQALSAIQANRVYGVFPYNFYTTNYESVFANAYFIGSVLYPEQFADIDPMAKAEEIATFLNGGPAFERINEDFENMGFGRITVQ